MDELKGDNFYFLESPTCDWLGPGDKALALTGKGYVIKAAKGWGTAIRVDVATKATKFERDGDVDSFALRVLHDKDLALEVNHRKMESGNMLSTWHCNGHRDWACKFKFNPDRTMSPAKSDLVLGVKHGSANLILVQNDDLFRIVFAADEALAERARQILEEQIVLEAEKAALEAEAQRICAEPAFRESLRTKGFAYIPSAVPPAVIERGLKEINRQLGSSASSPDVFRAKIFPNHIHITDLFNESILPYVVETLLGPKGSPYMMGSGQIALRFPGDFCAGGSADFDAGAFERLRRGWHIDGCPNNSIPGVTDHWGEVHNFDVLCGVLLTETSKPMSGELCVYSGSHIKLAEHFRQHGMDALLTRGNEALPTGPQTDELLGTTPEHCIGKQGDAFICNYMTAHFIAPNTAPNIRYAVYFRARGPNFNGPHNPEPMLDPLRNWRLGDGSQVVPAPRPAQPRLRKRQTLEDLEKEKERDRHYAAASNDHTIPDVRAR